MEKLYFVTGNQKKFEELQEIVRSMRAKAWKSLKGKLGLELQEKYHLTKSEQVPCGIEPAGGHAALSYFIPGLQPVRHQYKNAALYGKKKAEK